MKTLLVGMHFQPPAKLVLAALPAGTVVELIPEPENPYDVNAIKVWVDASAIDKQALVLESESLAGMGFFPEEILSGESICLGHIAASGGKPIAKAGAAGVQGLVGTVELLQTDNIWPVSGRLSFEGEWPVIEVED